MRNARLALSFLFVALLAAALRAEDPAPAGSHVYVNRELGVRFVGIFGWTYEMAAGGGSWNLLAKYEQEAYEGSVLLLTRSNTYESFEAMRTGLREEFPLAADGKDPAAGASIFKEVSFKEVAMRGGIKLPGIEVDAVSLQVSKEGKRREHRLQVRTYYGKNRLYRIACSVQRARHAKVKDLFERAVDSLELQAEAEATTAGTSFKSWRGDYVCQVPDGFSVNVPGDRAPNDVWFENRRAGIIASVVSYPFRGDSREHVDSVVAYYKDALKIESETAEVLGGTGLLGVVTKGDKKTRIAGIVRDGKVYRVHVEYPSAAEAEGVRVMEALLKSMKLG
ncbi:MAG: hypothetical protein ACT4PV_09585 [Planctomycetaceae bacterium]